MEKSDGYGVTTIDCNDFDNCIRKTLKDLDVTSIDAIQHLMTSCEIMTFLLTKLDPKGDKSINIIDDIEMEHLSKGLYISQSIAEKVNEIIEQENQ